MRKLLIASATVFALAGLAACQSPADEASEQQADALEAQAEAAPIEAQADALNAQADRVEQQAGNADGGMTTNNSPSSSANGSMTVPPGDTMAPATTPPVQ